MKTELAKRIKEDGQPIRAIHNYLVETMEAVLELNSYPDIVGDDKVVEEFKNCMICAVGLLTEEDE